MIRLIHDMINLIHDMINLTHGIINLLRANVHLFNELRIINNQSSINCSKWFYEPSLKLKNQCSYTPEKVKKCSVSSSMSQRVGMLTDPVSKRFATHQLIVSIVLYGKTSPFYMVGFQSFIWQDFTILHDGFIVLYGKALGREITRDRLQPRFKD